MEQAQARAAPAGKVADKLARLIDRYPFDKYVWIMPRLDIAGELPEHLDFMVSTRKFSIDEKTNDVYPIGVRSMKYAKEVALSKSSLMAIASDAGVKWIPNLNRRLDDGSNPDVVEWQATGILAGLSGMTPVTETKRVDLDLLRERDEWKLRNKPPKGISLPGAKWDKQNNRYEQTPWNQLTTDQRETHIRNKVTENDLQRKEFKVEMAETKAQLRVIRALLGIPSKFSKETIGNKEFAVLRIIFAPNAQTTEERKMIMQGMMNLYLGAYPGAESAGMLGEGPPAPVAIEPHQVQGALPEAEPVETPPPPVTTTEIANAEVVGNGENEEQKSTTDNFAYLQEMGKVKRRFTEALGKDGETEYYKVLKEFGAKHSNEILEKTDQGKVYRALVAKIELLEKNISKGETGGEGESEEEGEEKESDEWLYKALRADLLKKKKDELQHDLAGACIKYGYDTDDDPQGIKELLKNETKDNLAEAHIRVMRDKHQREKGGASQ